MSFGGPVFGATSNMGVAGYGGGPAVGNAPGAKSDVGYDTNSDAADMLRARVFVGNLSTPAVTRDQVIDIFRAYGRLLGVSVFKGYAFIQYGNARDADSAVQYTNRTMVGGQPIDVKLAASARNQKKPPMGGGPLVGTGGGYKRELTTLTSGMSPSPKTARVTLSAVGSFPSKPGSKMQVTPTRNAIRAQMDINKKAALEDNTDVATLPDRDAELCDTLICGQCRSVYTDFGEYREHRRGECRPPPSKPDDEPPHVVCFVCKEQFDFSWNLLKHLAASHNLKVYVSDDGAGDGDTAAKAADEAAPAKEEKTTSNGEPTEQTATASAETTEPVAEAEAKEDKEEDKKETAAEAE